MAHTNAGVVKLHDVSDFIAPAQACVVELGGAPAGAPTARAANTVTPAPRPSAAPPPPPPPPSTDPVKVTLHDCLACSGCVTSAEAVLLESQSAAELAAALADPGRRVVVTLAQQSAAALAAAAGTPAAVAAATTVAELRAAGADVVLDEGEARALAAEAAVAEFCARYAASAAGRAALAKHGLPGAADAAAATATALGVAPTPDTHPLLPVLAGACPGWVCFAEKTAPPAAARAAAAAPPPAAVAGAAAKSWLAAARGWPVDSVWHAAIAPCPDKKLEAVRDEWRAAGGTPFIDCVLTTAELAGWLASRADDAGGAPPRGAFDTLASAAAGSTPSAPAAPYAPGGSGGWAETVFRGAARRLFGVTVPPGPLAWVPGRNPDTKSATLVVGGDPVLTVATAHGLRNVQTVVRKLGTSASTLPHYVETMACPRGCANGGGQGVRGAGDRGGLEATAAALEAAAAPDWADQAAAVAARAAAAWPGGAPRLRAAVAARGREEGVPKAVAVSAVADW